MCGRFSQAASSRRLAAIFGAEPDDDLPDGSYNVAPTDPVRVVVEDEQRRRLIAARWDFRPFWASDDGKRTSRWINARAETAFASPAFGPALRQHRCVIPADAFYKWTDAGGIRQPYAIGPSADDGVLALAGIWRPPTAGLKVPGVAIFTSTPNELVQRIHNRIPVMFESGGGRWLAIAAHR